MSARTRRSLVAVGMLILIPALLNPADAARPQKSKPTTTTSSTTTTTAATAATTTTARSWAPAAAAAVRPGVQTVTEGGQCTANFVFVDTEGAVYLGQAAHCSDKGAATDTNGCKSDSHPLGTPVTIKGRDGKRRTGTLAYSSWITMKANKESNENICEFNDFALVRLADADVSHVNPSIPFFGGPTGLATSSPALGEYVYSYGNSSLRLGLSPLRPKFGVSVDDVSYGDGGWSHLVYTASPGIPGDSGSGFLDDTGKALGVLSTLQLLPYAGSNGVGDLSRELNYVNMHSGLPEVRLVLGTEEFVPLPAL